MRYAPGDTVRFKSTILWGDYDARACVLRDVVYDTGVSDIGVVMCVSDARPRMGASNQLLFIVCNGHMGYVWNEFVRVL